MGRPESYNKWIGFITDSGIEILEFDHYGTNKTKKYYKMKCSCGNIFINRLDLVLSGNVISCGQGCTGHTNKDYTDIESPSGFIFIERSYKNDKNQWIWKCKCKFCGNIINAIPSQVIKGCVACRCQNKRISIPERAIENILLNNNINFKSEVIFSDLYDKKPLRYDFAIFKQDKVIALIEYDGEQHYRKNTGIGTLDDYDVRHIHDIMKNEYAKNHNIPLLRITYLDKLIDFENIILTFLETLTTAGCA